MVKIINPIASDITVTIFGHTYTVKAESELSNVPREAAMYWKNSLHQFLMIAEETPVTKTVTKEEVKVEEVVEEKPKTKKK